MILADTVLQDLQVGGTVMLQKFLGAVVGLALAVMAADVREADATTVTCGSPCNPTGVQDLLVGSLTYDIIFTHATFATAFPNNEFFLDAAEIASAMVDALNVVGAGAIHPASDVRFNEFLIPFATTGLSDGTLALDFDGRFNKNSLEWFVPPRNTVLDSQAETKFVWAVPTLKTVAPIPAIPLPAALPLFGTGLAIMGFIGWRRRRRAAP